VDELGELAGFSLNVAYPAMHRLRDRDYVTEDRRRYSLSQRGRELVAAFETVHREGIRAYVDTLDHQEREQLLNAFANERPD
jgi:DNA-binding PadR family transcriptional regulator